MMYPRLELLRELLHPHGTIAVHLDDEELAYLTVIMDEIFGRKNRVNLVTFGQGAAVGHKAINPGMVTVSNFILVYAADKKQWKPNRVFVGRERDKRYASFIENYSDDFKSWKLVSLTKAFAASSDLSLAEQKKALGDEYEDAINDFVIENAHRVVQPVRPDYKSVGQATRDLIDYSVENPKELFLQERPDHPDIYLQNGKRWLFYKNKLKEVDGKLVAGEPVSNLWDDLRSNNLHNEGGVKFPKSKKPEALVKRVFEMFTKPGDIVLDSFLGSGTTAAAAHKMGLQWIGVEMGDHAKTLCATRMGAVIDGEQGGISKATKWKGGGGFRFCALGSTIFDAAGKISDTVRFDDLSRHIWFAETKSPLNAKSEGTVIGIQGDKAYALLFNGVLRDRSPQGGNVLLRSTLQLIRDDVAKLDPDFDGDLVIYAASTAFGSSTLNREGITFKQTPYDISAQG